jgi:hypothetical protein
MSIADEISLINRSTEVLAVLIEPEGHAVHVGPNQDCIVRAIRDKGDSREMRFEFTYEPGVIGVYLMCEKLVLIDGKKVL